MNKTIGFVGTGNMGQAMLRGIINANLVPSNNIIICDTDENKLKSLSNECSVRTTPSAPGLTRMSDIIILAVKPNIYDTVMLDIKPSLTADKIIVSIAAGKDIKSIENVLGDNTKIVRTMPNTPALVLDGMAAICPNINVTQDELDDVRSIFDSFGKSEIVPEKLMEAVIGISGSSPAYVFMFIEAMADAAVSYGMPRDMAYNFAAQAVKGSAKMVLETGKHPGALKDMVCSPGGTTIEAVNTLEQTGFRGSVITAVQACVEKGMAMKK